MSLRKNISTNLIYIQSIKHLISEQDDSKRKLMHVWLNACPLFDINCTILKMNTFAEFMKQLSMPASILLEKYHRKTNDFGNY